jgi:proteasome lid subunit RPN8/RPN11
MLAVLTLMFLWTTDATIPSDGGRETTTRAQVGEASELMQEPVVLSFCQILVRKARSEREAEQAAFIVRTAEGILYFVCWPGHGERNSAQWHGSFPEGTIAIVHTHPPWLPMPSKLDMATARRCQVPVYVLTTFEISITTGGEAEVLINGNWIAPSVESCRNCVSLDHGVKAARTVMDGP